jgi:hypothetical protein
MNSIPILRQQARDRTRRQCTDRCWLVLDRVFRTGRLGMGCCSSGTADFRRFGESPCFAKRAFASVVGQGEQFRDIYPLGTVSAIISFSSVDMIVREADQKPLVSS